MCASHPIVLIVGPTAGGKTALAVELCHRLPGGGECISADSMQVYRGMDIGTAKPSAEEREGVEHHLIDIVEPDVEGFAVDAWLEQCERTIKTLRARRKWPVVVGGTNLYIQALLYGLFDGPPADESLRAELALLDESALHARLTAVDPVAGGRIHRNDRKRAVRAIEVHTATGQPISALQGQWTEAVREDVVILGLDHPVPAINARINARVRMMMAQGLENEVRRLHEAGRLGVQAREALGYKQMIACIEGKCSRDEAVEQIKIRTRRFAKQQRTWLRRFRSLPNSRWIDVSDQDTETIVKEALMAIEEVVSKGK